MRPPALTAVMILAVLTALHVTKAKKGKDLDLFASTTQGKDSDCRDTSNSCRHLGKRRPASRCRRKSAQTHCCATCRRLASEWKTSGADGSTTAITDTPDDAATGCSDRHAWCSNIGQRYSLSSCYGENEQECCATCYTLRSNIPGCPFGDHNVWCRSMDLTRENCLNGGHREACCETCHQIFLKKETNTTSVDSTGQPGGTGEESPTGITHHHRHRHKSHDGTGGEDGEEGDGQEEGDEDSTSKSVVIQHAPNLPSTRAPPRSTSTLAPRLGRISPYELLNLTLQARQQAGQDSVANNKKYKPKPSSSWEPDPSPEDPSSISPSHAFPPSPAIPARPNPRPADTLDTEEHSGSALSAEDEYYDNDDDDDEDDTYSSVPHEGHLEYGFPAHSSETGTEVEEEEEQDLELDGLPGGQPRDTAPQQSPNSDMVKDQPKSSQPRPTKLPAGGSNREEFGPGEVAAGSDVPAMLGWAWLYLSLAILARLAVS